MLEVVALPWLLRWRRLTARAAEVDRRFLDVPDTGFVLPSAVLGILRLNPGDYWGVCTAASVIRPGWPLGGLDLVSRASVCRNITITLEDLFRGYVAGVVEEGRIVEDRLEVLRYLVIISTFLIT